MHKKKLAIKKTTKNCKIDPFNPKKNLFVIAKGKDTFVCQ
jgi:hypothetical protein